MKSRPHQLLSAAILAALSLLLTNCATTPFQASEDDPRLQRDLDNEPTFISESGYSYWKDQPGNGPLQVAIDLSEQTAYITRGSTPIARSRVATGKVGHRTPTGSFTITEKVKDKRSNLYGRIFDRHGNIHVRDADTRKHSIPDGGYYLGAPMPYWMRLTSGGIGMHVGPIPNPGRPASHGCIRMPREIARLLFLNAPVGTSVKIRR